LNYNTTRESNRKALASCKITDYKKVQVFVSVSRSWVKIVLLNISNWQQSWQLHLLSLNW